MKHQSAYHVTLPLNMKQLFASCFEVNSKTLPWPGFALRSLAYFTQMASFRNLSKKVLICRVTVTKLVLGG